MSIQEIGCKFMDRI